MIRGWLLFLSGGLAAMILVNVVTRVWDFLECRRIDRIRNTAPEPDRYRPPRGQGGDL